MADKKAGGLFADLALKGLDKLKSGLAEAASAFSSLRSSIASTASIANPVGWDNMRVAVFALNLQIGRIFIPLIREVTGWVQQLTQWFRNLTDSQREQILNWIRIGAAVGAVAALLPTVVSAVTGVTSAVYALGIAFRFLGFSIPAAGLASIVTVLGTVGLVMRSSASGSLSLTTALQSLMTALQSLWAVLQPVVMALVNMSTSLLTAIIEVLTYLWRTIQQVSESLSFLGDWLSAIATLLSPLVNLVSSIVGPWLRYAAAILAVIALGPALMGLFTLIVGGIRMIQGALTALMANPVALFIGAITAAIMLLTGALGNTNSELGELASRLEEIEATGERLRSGGAVTRRDLEQLPASVRQRIEAARTREERNRILDQEIANQQPSLRFNELRRREAGQAEAALEGMGSLSWWTHRDRRDPRAREVERAIGRPMSDEERRGFYALPGQNTDRLSRETLTQIGNLFRTQATRPETNIEILRAIRERGLPNEFRGQMRQMPAEFVSITDQWRRMMTATTESPEERMRREQLAETTRTRTAVESIRDGVREIAGRRPAPAVGPG